MIRPTSPLGPHRHAGEVGPQWLVQQPNADTHETGREEEQVRRCGKVGHNRRLTLAG